LFRKEKEKSESPNKGKKWRKRRKSWELKWVSGGEVWQLA